MVGANHCTTLILWSISQQGSNCLRNPSFKTFEILLSVFEIQMGHWLALFTYVLTPNSFACIKIKNEVVILVEKLNEYLLKQN